MITASSNHRAMARDIPEMNYGTSFFNQQSVMASSGCGLKLTDNEEDTRELL